MSGIIFGGLVIPDSSITPAKLSQPLTLATAVNSTSGTSIDFTGIPNWVDKITIMLSNVSTNGTSQPMFQIGDSGGIETTGYVTATANITTVANVSTAYTNGWQIYSTGAARVAPPPLTLTE